MYCHNCGAEVEDGLKFCSECGTQIIKDKSDDTRKNESVSNGNPIKATNSTSFMLPFLSDTWKKVLAFSIVIVITLIFVIGINNPKSSSNNSSSVFENNNDKKYDNTYEYDEEYDSSDYDSSSGYIDDFYVEIGDYRMSETTSGDPLIVITYSFTNNSDESASFTMSLDDKVYQNGMEIDQEFFGLYDDDVDNTVAGRDIKPGVKISFEAAYSLDNEYDDVEVEVGSMFDFSGDSKKVSKTFVID